MDDKPFIVVDPPKDDPTTEVPVEAPADPPAPEPAPTGKAYVDAQGNVTYS